MNCRTTTFRHATFIILVILVATSTTASAETFRIPLPELLGHRSVDDLSLQFFARPDPLAEIDRLPPGAISYRLEWSGTLRAGRVVGDGVIREPIERLLQGSFVPHISRSGESIGRFPASLTAFGSFEETWQLDRLPGGFIDWNEIGREQPPNRLSVTFKLVPDYLTLGDSIAFIEPPTNGESRNASDGLILLEPIEADITSAALVVEVIPEPTTVTFAIVAILIVALGCGLCRRVLNP